MCLGTDHNDDDLNPRDHRDRTDSGTTDHDHSHSRRLLIRQISVRTERASISRALFSWNRLTRRSIKLAGKSEPGWENRFQSAGGAGKADDRALAQSSRPTRVLFGTK